MKPAFLSKTEKGKVRCLACQHYCLIGENKVGICGIRKNIGGKLQLLAYGKVIAKHLDPIEKKPLYHFLPGTRAYSIGTVGCNFRCGFCQNWSISQEKKIMGSDLSPEQAGREAKNCPSMAYTYNEPTIFVEYARNIVLANKDKKHVFVRKMSFIDAPGHETLMATMLSGAAIMDGALLLVAANEQCPQPQTREHLMALEIIGIKQIIIVQNKVDLISEEDALNNYAQIQGFVRGTVAEKAPIIPISAQHRVNIDALLQTIQEVIQTPKRDDQKDARFYIARSFDVNRPGTEIEQLQGGVLGGALKQGILGVGDAIEIKPGIKDEDAKWVMLETKITDLKTGGESVQEVHPGGSVGILTELDPSIVKSDNLTGCVVSAKGKSPNVHHEFILKPKLLARVVGAKDDLIVEPIKKAELLMLNVNSAATVGLVDELKKNQIHVRLRLPVCADKGDRVTISRNIGSRWRLIGYAMVE